MNVQLVQVGLRTFARMSFLRGRRSADGVDAWIPAGPVSRRDSVTAFRTSLGKEEEEECLLPCGLTAAIFENFFLTFGIR